MPGDILNETNIDTRDNRVACGVAVVVTHQDKVLFGQRKSGQTGFEWQLPGGWIDAGESPAQAARREVHEETGLQLEEPRFVGITSNVFSAHEHTISLYFEAKCVDARSLLPRENGKCYSWHWKDWADLTENLFLALRLLKQTDYQPFANSQRKTYIYF